ncbi:hypothetical protein QFC19_006659 [Naganishia cerealis]|uniref:Uncharacterized protein n=1 Tax=Naganishia cerealis TaxID=610337 RepID=A0ACC2VFE3_9TREE|nr:hypothetical protein QFC19_006659 [Naganishia cerealis]
MIGIPPRPVCFSGSRPSILARQRRQSKVDEIFGVVLKRARLQERFQDSSDAVLHDDFSTLLSALADVAHDLPRNVPVPPMLVQYFYPSINQLEASAPRAPSCQDSTLIPTPAVQMPPSQPNTLPLLPNRIGPLTSPRLESPAWETLSAEPLPGSLDDGSREIEDMDDESDDGDNLEWAFGEAVIREPSEMLRDTQDGLFQRQSLDDGSLDDQMEAEVLNKEWAAYCKKKKHLGDCALIRSYLLYSSLFPVSRRMSEDERVKLVAQAILSTRMTQSDNDKLQNMPGTEFEEDTFLSEFRIRRELEKETNLQGQHIDCCGNGCIAFTGPYKDWESCPLCQRSRWIVDCQGRRKARQTYTYISPLGRLKAMWRDKEACQHLAYRATRTHDPDLLEDVFDGKHFEALLETNVTWAGSEVEPPRRYFENDTDIALGLGTDGIPLFSRSPKPSQ